MEPGLRVAYLVSRFPHVSETFIVRELDAVAATGLVDIELRSLFPARNEVVHPAAVPWTRRLRRATAVRALLSMGRWLLNRPVRLVSSFAIVLAAHWRRPTLAARALTTCMLACQHALEVERDRPDHLHAHYATYPALAAWLCFRLTGIPYSFTGHAHDLYVDQSMLARKVREARFVVAISDFNRAFLRSCGSIGTTEIHVVHCGVDPAAFEFRVRVPRLDQPTFALCVASLQEYKGHAVLFRALATRAELDLVELHLVGTGPLLEDLKDLATSLGIESRVQFEGGRTEDEVLELLDRADVAVLPSIVARDGQMEGIPVALMEALAAGVPAVATRLSGIPELIVDGATGVLATPGDADSLAVALVRTLSDSEACAKRVWNGRAKIEAEFDVKRSGRRMAELFRGST